MQAEATCIVMYREYPSLTAVIALDVVLTEGEETRPSILFAIIGYQLAVSVYLLP